MKYIYSLILAVLLAPIAYAVDYSFVVTGGADGVISGNLANEDGLAYNRNYYANIDNYGGSKVSAELIYSSATFASVTFGTMSYTTGSGNISITAHGLTTALPVLLRATGSNAPSPLVAETTYYALPVSVNVVRLSSTSALAQANEYIVMGSSFPQGGTQTYTLIPPSSIVGTPTIKFQGSNNGSNWFDIDIQQLSITEYTAGGASVGFDFDDFNYSNLKMVVVSPTTGALNLKAKLNIKQK